MAKSKTIFLLLGPKGSGKTHIGSIFEKSFNIQFIRVENWILNLKGNRNLDDEDYIRECFEIIENGIRNELQRLDVLVFESTGLSVYFENMILSLQSDFRVIRITIHAPLELCLERVRKRDQSIHINVSDDQVNEINNAVFRKEHEAEFKIDNSNKTDRELKNEIVKILKSFDV